MFGAVHPARTPVRTAIVLSALVATPNPAVQRRVLCVHGVLSAIIPVPTAAVLPVRHAIPPLPVLD